jgi:acylphosphatase
MAVRRHVHYSGDVQGVGFRFEVTRLAAGRRVTGFVRNLPDGRVEAVAEGDPDEVEGLLADVRRAMGRHIRDEKAAQETPTGEFDGFGVKFC